MSSPFASVSKSHRIPCPWDPAHWFVVRALTGREEELAEREHMRNVVNGRSSRGWAKQLAMIFSGEAQLDKRDIDEIMKDPLAGVDRTSVVRSGLMEWSYGEIDAKQVTDLLDEPLEFIALEVWKRTHPGLFQTEDEREAAQKNG